MYLSSRTSSNKNKFFRETSTNLIKNIGRRFGLRTFLGCVGVKKIKKSFLLTFSSKIHVRFKYYFIQKHLRVISCRIIVGRGRCVVGRHLRPVLVVRLPVLVVLRLGSRRSRRRMSCSGLELAGFRCWNGAANLQFVFFRICILIFFRTFVTVKNEAVNFRFSEFLTVPQSCNKYF